MEMCTDDEVLRDIERTRAEGWGAWKLSVPGRLLFMEYGSDTHCVRIDELFCDRELLYIVLQFSRKCWATDAHVGSLVRAASDIRAVAKPVQYAGVGQVRSIGSRAAG